MSASLAGIHPSSGCDSHTSASANSTAARRNASSPGCLSPFRHTNDTGDNGTGSTIGRATVPGMAGKSATASTGDLVFAMIRRNSSSATASGAGAATSMPESAPLDASGAGRRGRPRRHT